MVRRVFSTSALLVSFLLLSGSALADHHEAGEVEAAVKKFYSQLSSHDYKGALGQIAIGGKGYVATGELRTIDSEAIRESIVQRMKDNQDNGAEMDLRPRDFSVVTHGGLAIATYMLDATTKASSDEEEEEEVNRGTLVWAKKGNTWKIVHWHISKLEADE